MIVRREPPARRPERERRAREEAHQHPRRGQGREYRPHAARALEIEWALEWMEDDELLEVTPQTLRAAQTRLGVSQRKR